MSFSCFAFPKSVVLMTEPDYCKLNKRSDVHITEPNYCCRWTTTSITYSECVSVALIIQHAKRMRRTVVCGLFGSTVFSYIVSQMARFSEKNVIECKTCVLIFCTNFCFSIFLILRITERNIIINVYCSLCNVPVTDIRFLWNWNFPR